MNSSNKLRTSQLISKKEQTTLLGDLTRERKRLGLNIAKVMMIADISQVSYYDWKKGARRMNRRSAATIRSLIKNMVSIKRKKRRTK